MTGSRQPIIRCFGRDFKLVKWDEVPFETKQPYAAVVFIKDSIPYLVEGPKFESISLVSQRGVVTHEIAHILYPNIPESGADEFVTAIWDNRTLQTALIETHSSRKRCNVYPYESIPDLEHCRTEIDRILNHRKEANVCNH